jgi:hypothetical protein
VIQWFYGGTSALVGTIGGKYIRYSGGRLAFQLDPSSRADTLEWRGRERVRGRHNEGSEGETVRKPLVDFCFLRTGMAS